MAKVAKKVFQIYQKLPQRCRETCGGGLLLVVSLEKKKILNAGYSCRN